MSVRDREDAVVALLHALAPHLDGEPDPAFRAATRARLVAMAAVRTPEPAPAPVMQRLLAVRAPDVAPARWRSRLTAGLAGAAVAVTALASLVAVSTDAGPGDALYSLKRGTEQTQLALAGDARGQTLLDFAGTRLDELEELVGDGASALPAAAVPDGSAGMTVLAAEADPALVLATLDTMDAQTTEGAAWLTDRAVATQVGAPLDDLAGWAAEQSAGVAALRPLVPATAEDAVGRSLVLLSQIAARVNGLRSAVDCPQGPAVNGADALGPVPGLCLPPQPAPPPTGGEGSGGSSTAPAPQASVPTLPSTESAGGIPGAGVPGTGGLPTPAVPSVPGPGGGLIPSLPIPPLPGGTTGGTTGGGTGGDSSTPSPVLDVPIAVCLPPLATIGDC